MNEEQIREIVRDKLTNMEVKFYSHTELDEKGNKVIQLIGEESNELTL